MFLLVADEGWTVLIKISKLQNFQVSGEIHLTTCVGFFSPSTASKDPNLTQKLTHLPRVKLKPSRTAAVPDPVPSHGLPSKYEVFPLCSLKNTSRSEVKASGTLLTWVFQCKSKAVFARGTTISLRTESSELTLCPRTNGETMYE